MIKQEDEWEREKRKGNEENENRWRRTEKQKSEDGERKKEKNMKEKWRKGQEKRGTREMGDGKMIKDESREERRFRRKRKNMRIENKARIREKWRV